MNYLGNYSHYGAIRFTITLESDLGQRASLDNEAK